MKELTEKTEFCDLQPEAAGCCASCSSFSYFSCGSCCLCFCNDRKNKVSHLLIHLVKNKHFCLKYKDKEICCAHCREKNIFKLFRNEVEICCKACVTGGAGKTCKFSLEGEAKPEDWSSGFAPLVKENFIEIFQCIPLFFSSPEQYLALFLPLINKERLKEKELKEKMKQENVTLRFFDNFVFFYCNNINEIKINIGDEIRFTKGAISFRGFVCEDNFTEELKVEIVKGDYPKTGYTVEYVYGTTSYERMIYAVKKLCKDYKKNKIFQKILRLEKEEHIAVADSDVLLPPSFPTLNASQSIAIKAALSQDLTLIQGPPGTGKTMLSAVIVYNFIRKMKKKVLVISPSNTAVDQITLKINNAGLKVLRVVSKRRENKDTAIEELCLHTILRECVATSEYSQSDLYNLKNDILGLADVVCATCVTSGQKLFNRFYFPVILIDEAVQCTEPLTLIPLVYRPEHLILVGDHKQLGPMVLSKECAEKGYKQSLFERLVKMGKTPYLLDIQYRMTQNMCDFVSEYFYEGMLRSADGSALFDSKCNLLFNALSAHLPSNNFFYISDGPEEVSKSNTSFCNLKEAVAVENFIKFFFKIGVMENQIGVVTPYEGQRTLILKRISECGNLEISNVDAFQGREKDFIIVSLVRSNNSSSIGFVSDRRRLNVILTRAKYGLIIIGNPYTLYKNRMWADLLHFYNKKGNIYKGDINSLNRVKLNEYLGHDL